MLYKPGAVREVQVVLREMERAGLTPSPHDLALAAATFAWNKKPKLAATMRDDALAALDSTDSPEAEVVGAYTAQDARTMHDVTCELLLESCRRSGDTAAAMSTWTWMRARSLWPTPAGLTHLLVAFARAADWRSAVTALTECDAEGRRSGTSGGGVVTKVEHWNVLLSAFVRAGELRKAEDLLRNLEQRAAVTGGEEVVTAVDTVSYNTLLFGYVTVTDEVGADAAGGSSYGDGHLGRVERFDALLRRMDEANVPRDASTYRAMINLHQLDASRVLEIAQEAEERGVAWRWRAYAAAARALLWGRRAEDARGLMRRMHEIGVEPTTDFYRILVEAAESAGLHDEADWLHREGLSRALQPGHGVKGCRPSPKGGAIGRACWRSVGREGEDILLHCRWRAAAGALAAVARCVHCVSSERRLHARPRGMPSRGKLTGELSVIAWAASEQQARAENGGAMWSSASRARSAPPGAYLSSVESDTSSSSIVRGPPVHILSRFTPLSP